ncbi:hypothetical protein F5884DRAFT_756145 [Xylogone sp. PMI_703]|nr:hypothetical protein F5884DRAFT_756145 [Xylogone sp. PMI_703]
MAHLSTEYKDRNMPAHNDEWFDSLEWNSNVLGASASDNSPEPLSITPQKVAYTTVGSLVDPNSAPRFTAPNRIQRYRDVSGRKSYGSSSSYHNSESHYQSNDPFALQNAIVYAHTNPQNTGSSLQNLQPRDSMSGLSSAHRRAPVSHLSTPSKFRSGTAMRSQYQNTQSPLETPALIKQFLGRSDHTLIDNVEKELGMDGNTCGTGNDLATENAGYLTSSFHNVMQKNITNYEYNIQKLPLSMDNQSDRLNSTISNMASNNASFVKGDQQNRDTAFYSSNNKLADTMKSLPFSSTKQYSKADRSAIYSKFLSRGQVSGYPQPLTAGPPGGRQYNRDQATQLNSRNNLISASLPCTNSIKEQGLAIGLPVHEVADKKGISDTLPISLASKHYPFSLPGDMNGKFRLLSADTQKHMEQVSIGNFEPHEKHASIQKAAEIDEWFYSGQRQLFMTADDYINGMEKVHKAGQWLSVNRPSELPDTCTENCPLTFEELNRMTTADSAAPFLDAAFGTLLSYAYRDPSSARSLSNYRPALPREIDPTNGGNSSFFSKSY